MSNPVTSLHNYLAKTQSTSSLSWAETKKGTDHAPTWLVECKRVVKGTAEAPTINQAKQEAAKKALAAIKADLEKK
ncbi:hypothetical protein JR316_0000419 [Psilocybe cubensis]|uniref:Uncharacterized protein n=2 Tax=Psilocybe cubensis TaxID=181762 RepID=A0ACB8HEB2_PSICU|nr:hypothetical protein JR316_0000419 [Psilocybe cubensis]KAH9486355.1 hypothetical protein JR316_0000419 [Psilocybe cubensis]